MDDALLLHQALPASGYASQRALTRLALYQARARAFGMVGRLELYRQRLGRPPLAAHIIPPGMVRDIALPPSPAAECREAQTAPHRDSPGDPLETLV